MVAGRRNISSTCCCVSSPSLLRRAIGPAGNRAADRAPSSALQILNRCRLGCWRKSKVRAGRRLGSRPRFLSTRLRSTLMTRSVDYDKGHIRGARSETSQRASKGVEPAAIASPGPSARRGKCRRRWTVRCAPKSLRCRESSEAQRTGVTVVYNAPQHIKLAKLQLRRGG